MCRIICMLPLKSKASKLYPNIHSGCLVLHCCLHIISERIIAFSSKRLEPRYHQEKKPLCKFCRCRLGFSYWQLHDTLVYSAFYSLVEAVANGLRFKFVRVEQTLNSVSVRCFQRDWRNGNQRFPSDPKLEPSVSPLLSFQI